MSQVFNISISPTSATSNNYEPKNPTLNASFLYWWIHCFYFISYILWRQISINKTQLYTALISILIVITYSETHTLFTTLNIGTDYSVGNGNIFDICAKTNIQITSFDVHCKAWPPADPAGFVIAMTTEQISYTDCGFQCWTSIHDETKTCKSEGTLTVLSTFNQGVGPVFIDNGQCRGFYVTRKSGLLGHIAGISEGRIYRSNNEIDVKEGIAINYCMGSHSYGPRVWNGRIHYNTISLPPSLAPTQSTCDFKFYSYFEHEFAEQSGYTLMTYNRLQESNPFPYKARFISFL
eukprot:44435_1